MRTKLVLWAMVLFLATGGAWAQTTEEKLDKIEKELADLKTQVGAAPEGKDPVTSKWGTKFYGFVRFIGSYDNATTNNAGQGRWVNAPEDTTNADNDQITATAAESRIGFDFKCPDWGGAKTTGKIEADFLGAGGTANTTNLRLRFAFVDVNYPDYGANFFAGQCKDLVAPLTTEMLATDSQLHYTGNTGYRRPMIGGREVVALGNAMEFTLAGAAARGLESTETGSAGDDAQNSHFPDLQARAGIGTTALGTDKKIELGVGGMYGKEEVSGVYTAAQGGNYVFEKNLVAADLLIPTEYVDLKGEAYFGKNVDDYYGGINQGIRPTFGVRRSLKDRGGWGQVSVKAVKDVVLNVGAGVDDPKDRELAAGARSRNYSHFANVTYDLNKAVTLGLEFQEIFTEFNNTGSKGARQNRDDRGTMSVTFKF